MVLDALERWDYKLCNGKRMESNGCLSWKLHGVKVGKKFDFPYLEIFQSFLQKWPIMFCIQTWPSSWNFLLTKNMELTRLLEWHFETLTIQNLQTLRQLWVVEVGKKITKWPIIFCIFKSTSIYFPTFHIKEGINFTFSR